MHLNIIEILIYQESEYPILCWDGSKMVAQQLGNRPATCRKYYVHPGIIDAYIEATLSTLMQQKLENLPQLSRAKQGVLSVLRQLS